MALDIPITNQVEVMQQAMVATTKTRINAVMFDFNSTKAITSISFGDDINGVFSPVYSETWILSGNYYLGLVAQTVTAGVLGNELLSHVASAISTIQLDAALKAQLQNSNELVILSADILEIITATTQAGV